MAEKLGLGNEVRQLKIGQSFTNPKSSSFHSIKYDFKPASVDTNKMATVDVGSNHQVTVTVPHLDGAGVPQTVFKGSQRPYQKECVLIIDRVTGEITLEKLACNIQVKKTRSESAKLPLPHDRLSQNNGRSQTPPTVGHRVSHRTKVTSGSRRPDRPITHLVPKHSPLGASPNYPSPVHHKSPKNNTNESHNSNQGNSSTLASLPMIGGMDDFPDPPVAHVQASVSLPSLGNNSHSTSSTQNHNGNNIMNSNHGSGSNNMNNSNHDNDKSSPTSAVFPLRNQNNDHPGAVVGEITDSSSSSSGDSDSDTDDPDKTVIHKVLPTAASMSSYAKTNGHHSLTNGVVVPPPPQHQSPVNKLPTHLLNEDLCLSESGSDSD